VQLVNSAAQERNSPYKEFINNPALLLETKEIPYTFEYVLESKKPFSVEIQSQLNAGKVYYEYFGFPIFDNKRNVTKIIEYAVDITDKKNAVDKIKSAFEREKELNDLKSQFISSTSHEFRTPLATLYSSVELIQHYDKTKSENKKLYHLARIKGIVKYMTSMLDDILTINKADMNKLDFQPSMINLRDFCNEIMEDIVVLAYSQHYINVSIEGDYKDVILDTKLLRHILTNLLSNAIKYSPDGGQILFKTFVKEDTVEFTIRDEGIGIPDGDLINLFQHFFRARNVGTISGAGLGLAIVKKAVEVHGGTIEFKSEVGKGTTFIVKLPLQRELQPANIKYS
jgi:signal transduction histidine kinase